MKDSSRNKLRRCFAELVGTFCLVFAGTGAIVINDVSEGKVTHVGVALTFGLVVMSMIYAIGDVSGAHMNPAVTIGFTLAQRFPARDAVPYVFCQVLGAVIASLVLRGMFPTHSTLGATTPAGAAMQSFWLETVLTGMLMFVVLGVSTGAKEKGVVAGIAVGGVVGFEAMFGGPISGASMNPARSLGPALVSGDLSNLWVYVVAPIVGAAIAVVAWLVMAPSTLSPSTEAVT